MPHTMALVLTENMALAELDEPSVRPGPVGDVGVLTGDWGVTDLLFA